MATILITDDEANIRDHLASYVRGLGHEVETASGESKSSRSEATSPNPSKPNNAVLTRVELEF